MTDHRLTAPSAVKAVLIGVSSYHAGFPAVPADNSLRRMREVLTDPELCGWPEDQVIVIEDPQHTDVLGQRIVEEAAERTTETFLLYYVGHGMIYSRNELSLTVTGSRPGSSMTSLRWQGVREAVEQCEAAVRISILDCCFAGNATLTVTNSESLANAADIEGCYTLAATSPNARARNGPPDGCTLFTDVLCDIITEGIDNGSEFLTFEHIFPELKRRLGIEFPPSQKITGWINGFRFTRNKAYQAHRSSASAGQATTPPTDADGWIMRLGAHPQANIDDLLARPLMAAQVAAELYRTGDQRRRGTAQRINDTANVTLTTTSEFAAYWNELDRLLPHDEATDELRYRWTASADTEQVAGRIAATRPAGDRILRQCAARQDFRGATALCKRVSFSDALTLFDYAIERNERWDISHLAKLLWERQQAESSRSSADMIEANISWQRNLDVVARLIESDSSPGLSHAILAQCADHMSSTQQADLLIRLRGLLRARRDQGSPQPDGANHDWPDELLLLCLSEPPKGSTADSDGALPEKWNEFLVKLHDRGSPEKIFEEWADARLLTPDRKKTIDQLVAIITACYRYRGSWLRPLLEHIGSDSSSDDLLAICEKLHDGRQPGGKAVEHIRGSISRRDIHDEEKGLPKVILRWRATKILSGSLNDLLSDIVKAMRTPYSSGADQIDDLDGRLSTSEWSDYLSNNDTWSNHGTECARRLRVEDARYIDSSSTGEQIAKRVCRVSRERDRDQVARENARFLTTQLHPNEDGDRARQDNARQRIEQYLISLCKAHENEAVYLTCREVGQLPENAEVNAEGVLKIGLRLCQEKYDRPGQDILERVLDNVYNLPADRVCAMIKELKTALMDNRLQELLQKTIGQWFDLKRRTLVAQQLLQGNSNNEFNAEAAAITPLFW